MNSKFTNIEFLIKTGANFCSCILLLFSAVCNGQTLSLKDAVEQGATNYGMVKAKSFYAKASLENIDRVKRDYLPNLNLSSQQNFGSINGQNGPLYNLEGLGVSSSGLPLPNQTWSTAFGSLYVANVNWDFFTFGKIKQRIAVSKSEAVQAARDYEQELFQHKVKIADAYLNLLGSQRLLVSQQRNLERTELLHRDISARVQGGLLPGVDASVATAEVSRAKILINQGREQVKIQNNELAQLLGDEIKNFQIDTSFLNTEPQVIHDVMLSPADTSHPVRAYFDSRINYSLAQEILFKKNFWPTLTFFGIHQARGSGFSANYALDQTAYTSNYFEGIRPSRQNFVLGIGIVWNITNIARATKDVSAQQFITQGLQEEYKAIDIALRSQEDAANARIKYALINFREAPTQVSAAEQAYYQRLALYNNGLTNLTDLTTAQYMLSRAEADLDIASVNLWQSLLMKAASVGDFDLFIDEF